MTGLRPEGCGIAAFGGDEYEVCVTGLSFVSPVLDDGEPKPPSFGRGCRRRRRRIAASVISKKVLKFDRPFGPEGS